MSKYNDMPITVGELTELHGLIDILSSLSLGHLSIDHVQVGDSNGDILGKLQYENREWTFRARRHDKPGVLGE